jgi:hypothetical protein
MIINRAVFINFSDLTLKNDEKYVIINKKYVREFYESPVLSRGVFRFVFFFTIGGRCL